MQSHPVIVYTTAHRYVAVRTLADKLSAEGVLHKMWIEKPENIPTAIALKPYPRSRVVPLLKKYQLFK